MVTCLIDGGVFVCIVLTAFMFSPLQDYLISAGFEQPQDFCQFMSAEAAVECNG
jgi:hypothetical protein